MWSRRPGGPGAGAGGPVASVPGPQGNGVGGADGVRVPGVGPFRRRWVTVREGHGRALGEPSGPGQLTKGQSCHTHCSPSLSAVRFRGTPWECGTWGASDQASMTSRQEEWGDVGWAAPCLVGEEPCSSPRGRGRPPCCEAPVLVPRCPAQGRPDTGRHGPERRGGGGIQGEGLTPRGGHVGG